MGDPSPPSGREEPVVIRVSDVRKTFRSGEEEVEALRGVSFEVQRGTGLFIVGPSGSGKSTLLYLLGALDNPTSGTIVIDGANITAMDEVQGDVFRRGKIGFVFQQFRHGSGGGDSSGWTGSMLGGDPGPMRSRSGIEPAFIPRSWRGFVQPRTGCQFIAWRR